MGRVCPTPQVLVSLLDTWAVEGGNKVRHCLGLCCASPLHTLLRPLSLLCVTAPRRAATWRGPGCAARAAPAPRQVLLLSTLRCLCPPPCQVLLFSNSVRLLRILHSLLDARAYDYLMLDGSVAQQVCPVGQRCWVSG